MDFNGRLKDNTSKILSYSAKIREFLDDLLDAESFVETDVFMSGKDYLDGSDALGEGVITGYASINDYPVCISAHNNEVLGGSLGQAQAEKILKCIKKAVKTNTTFVAVINSNGARIGEGTAMLEGYGKIIAAVSEAKAYIPTVAIVQGNAIGLMGMFTAAFDFVYMTGTSAVSALPPLVLAESSVDAATKILGKDAYSKNSLVSTFTFDTIGSLKAQLIELFGYISEDFVDTLDDQNRVCDAFNEKVAPDVALLVMADDSSYLELYKDFAPDVKTAFAAVNTVPVGLVITNGEKLSINAIKKIKKFVKLLEAYNLPLITLVDSAGLDTDLAAEQEGVISECTELLAVISTSNMPKLAVITGSAIGFSYVALASKSIGFDYVLASSSAKIAPITSEAAVNILYAREIDGENIEKSRENLADKYAQEESNPFISAKDGFVDNIIEPALIRPYIASALTMLVK